MTAKTRARKAKKDQQADNSPDEKVIRARSKFVEGLISAVLRRGVPLYMTQGNLVQATESGKKAIRRPQDRAKWAVTYLNEIILGLDLARYTLTHIEEVMTDEDELNGLKPHIRQWLEEESYEYSERMVDDILMQLKDYWDKFDPQAWEDALRRVENEDYGSPRRERQ